MFQFYNAEPSGKRLEDCVIRAISLALQLPYFEVVKMLDDNGNYYSCDDICLSCYEKLLSNFGFTKNDAQNKTVSEVAKYGDVVLIRIPGHLTCSIDGVIFDIWDCSDKIADCYWIVDRSIIMLEKIEAYIKAIDIEGLSLEDMEHYTKIVMMLENAKSLKNDKNDLLYQIKMSKQELKQS